MARRRKDGLRRPRRRYGSLVIETYIYLHNQNPEAGVIVRRHYFRKGKWIGDKSKYFSEYRYGSLATAIWHAVRWKNANIADGTTRRRSAA